MGHFGDLFIFGVIFCLLLCNFFLGIVLNGYVKLKENLRKWLCNFFLGIVLNGYVKLKEKLRKWLSLF